MHTMCRSSWTSICSSVAMKSPRKREKPIVEEFFLPCTAMCRKFHSLCFAQIISDMDSSDDYRAATTSLSQGLFPSWWSLVLSCCANSAFVLCLHLFSLCTSLYMFYTLFPLCHLFWLQFFSTAALIWMCTDEIHMKLLFIAANKHGYRNMCQHQITIVSFLTFPLSTLTPAWCNNYFWHLPSHCFYFFASYIWILKTVSQL